MVGLLTLVIYGHFGYWFDDHTPIVDSGVNCERIATIAFPIWGALSLGPIWIQRCRRFSIRTRPVLSTFD